MGRILIAGEPGNQILPELAPVDGEIVIDKPGKGMFWATGLHETLSAKGITQLVLAGVNVERRVRERRDLLHDGEGTTCVLGAGVDHDGDPAESESLGPAAVHRRQ